jgi:hypothetical protein
MKEVFYIHSQNLIKAMKLLILSLIITLSFNNEFEKGYDAGYNQGYCYLKVVCIPTTPPMAPMPEITESADSYQDGYNRGFSDGKADQ